MHRIFASLICSIITVAPLHLSASIAEPPARPKPWLARGTVTDTQGEPISGAEIIAHCGRGTLLPTGKAISGPDGKYELPFGPGIWSKDLSIVQAATISVHKPGFFETNLYRQGDLVASHKLPEGPLHWGNKTAADLFLPDQPRTINFVLAPAGSLSGVVQTASGKPLANKRIGLTGEALPPSSSVIAEKKTDAEGRFEFNDVPTGYRWKLYVDDGRADWRNWPSTIVNLDKPAPHTFSLQLRGDHLDIQNISD